ncbi:MAG: hypothetical protein ACK5JM_01925 [Rhodoblastus sp.]
MIRKTIFAAMVLAGSAFGALSPASAMPFASDFGAQGAQVEFVRGGCRSGWRPDHWGRCVRDYRPRRARPPRWGRDDYRDHRPRQARPPRWDRPGYRDHRPSRPMYNDHRQYQPGRY